MCVFGFLSFEHIFVFLKFDMFPENSSTCFFYFFSSKCVVFYFFFLCFGTVFIFFPQPVWIPSVSLAFFLLVGVWARWLVLLLPVITQGNSWCGLAHLSTKTWFHLPTCHWSFGPENVQCALGCLDAERTDEIATSFMNNVFSLFFWFIIPGCLELQLSSGLFFGFGVIQFQIFWIWNCVSDFYLFSGFGRYSSGISGIIFFSTCFVFLWFWMI